MVTMNVLYERRDLFHADDKQYLNWFLFEAGASAIIHSMIMLIIAVVWMNSDIFQVYLNDCAKETLEDSLTYICIGIACMAALHFVLTLVYVKYLPHVWKLDPKRRCSKVSRTVLESHDVQNGLQAVNVPMLEVRPIENIEN